MKYRIDPKGNITLNPNQNDINVLMHALSNRKVLLHKINAEEKEINETKNLLLILDSAIIDSNKAKLDNLVPNEILIEPTQIKRGFWSRLKNTIEAPFSIADFESARTISGEKVFITSMDFLESGKSHPYNVIGMVFHQRKWYNATWSKYGSCKCDEIGINAAKFNLLRNDPTTVLTQRINILSSVAIIIILIILAII